MTVSLGIVVESGEDAMADLGLHPREGETVEDAALRLGKWVHWFEGDPCFERQAASDLRVALGFAPEPDDWTGFTFG